MTQPVSSVAEHWDVMWYLVVVLIGGGIMETLRRLTKIERKQDQQIEMHTNCRLSLLSKQEFKDWVDGPFFEWKAGRAELWDAINHHGHDVNGKVTRE